MSRKSQEQTIYFTSTTLVNLLSISWSGFYKFQKRGIIVPPDAFVNGRPVWLRERVNQIGKRIDELQGKN